MKEHISPLLQIISMIMFPSVLVGCGGPSTEELEAVDNTPVSRDEWPVSTPEEQGYDDRFPGRSVAPATWRRTLKNRESQSQSGG